MLLLIIVILVILALAGGGIGYSRYGGMSLSPLGILLVIILILWLAGVIVL